MFGTRRALLGGNALDPDALAYFARAGISDGAVTPTAYDNAASFNGSSQYLTVADNSTLNLSGTNFTISCWYYVAATNASNRYVFAKTILNLLPLNYGFRIVAGGTTTQFIFSNGATYYFPSGPSAVLGSWNHLVIKYDGTNLTMYGNGVAGTPVAMPAAIENSIANFSIGRPGSHTLQYFDGNVAGFAIWKRSLSSTEVTTLYNGGIGLTYSGIVSAGLTSNIQSYWALNQTSVTADSAGSNTLTNNGTVTATVLSPIATSTASARQLINSFVKQIKGLGLWSSMVCWPLRSSQNQSATGTSVYSLGGLGSFTGTRVGASSWSSAGLVLSNATLASNNQYVTIPTSLVSSGLNQFAIGIGATSSANYNRFFHMEDGTTDGRNVFLNHLNDGTLSFYLPNKGGSLAVPSFTKAITASPKAVIGSKVGTTLTVSLNASSTDKASATQTAFALPSSGTIGAMGYFYDGYISFNMLGRFDASSDLVSKIYNLYKSTIGQGLTLP
jgi:hypothetical protein